jgi:TPR repeat protein
MKKVFNYIEKQGNIGIHALYFFSKMLSERKKCKTNLKKANHLFSKAFKELKNGDIENYSKISYCLALYYKRGYGTEKNQEKAVELLNNSILLNEAAAIYKLARCYEQGKGIEKNREKAIELYLRDEISTN